MERVPAAILLIAAIVSLQIGSAIAVTLFPSFGPVGAMFLRMAFGGLILVGFYRTALLGAARKKPVGVIVLSLIMTAQTACFCETLDRIPLGLAVAIEGGVGLALVMSVAALAVWSGAKRSGVFLATAQSLTVPFRPVPSFLIQPPLRSSNFTPRTPSQI